MDNIIMLITILISYLAIAGAFAMFPYVSRRTVIFGVSVPEDVYQDPRVSALRSAYRNGVLIAGAVFVAVQVLLYYLGGFNETAHAVWLSILIFINLFVCGAIYLRAYTGMKRLKAEEGWNKDAPQLVTVDTGFRRKKSMVSPLYFVSHIVLIASTVIVSLLRYDALPAMIPTTFDSAGNAVGWMEKSYKALLIMPGIELFMTLIMFFAYYMIAKSRQQIDPANREVSLMQNMVFRRRWSAFTVYGGLLMAAVFSLVQLTILGILDQGVTTAVSLALPLVIIGAVIVLAVTTGQSGSRVKVGAGEYPPAKKAAVREDDSNWKYGVWYYNPGDPSLFVEKRVGIGWTVNWGRPMAWVILLGILALVIGSMVFSFGLGK